MTFTAGRAFAHRLIAEAGVSLTDAQVDAVARLYADHRRREEAALQAFIEDGRRLPVRGPGGPEFGQRRIR